MPLAGRALQYLPQSGGHGPFEKVGNLGIGGQYRQQALGDPQAVFAELAHIIREQDRAAAQADGACQRLHLGKRKLRISPHEQAVRVVHPPVRVHWCAGNDVLDRVARAGHIGLPANRLPDAEGIGFPFGADIRADAHHVKNPDARANRASAAEQNRFGTRFLTDQL